MIWMTMDGYPREGRPFLGGTKRGDYWICGQGLNEKAEAAIVVYGTHKEVKPDAWAKLPDWPT
jgi:hypothetical protein